MKTLGLLFILCGLVLVFTVVLAWPGAIAIAIGALLAIAGRGTQQTRAWRICHAAIWACVVCVVVGGALFWYGVAKYGPPSRPGATSHAVQSPARSLPARRAATR